MRIVVIGGGPAGLYAALLLKKERPEFEVTVLERGAEEGSFDWGIVFPEGLPESFRHADEPSYRAISARCAHWTDIDVVAHGQRITSGGHHFSGIGRGMLLRILRARASEVGVDLRFETEVRQLASLEALDLDDADVVVAADGAGSAVRTELAHVFQPELEVRTARYVVFGTPMPFDASTFYIVETEHGVFHAHAYRFDAERSTVIVECDEASWRAAGFDALDASGTIEACERLFADWLGSHRLTSDAARASSLWTRFTRVTNGRWFHENVVLVGDAAHTAHFSIGSGTALAMDDAIALARVLAAVSEPAAIPEAFGRYQEERLAESRRLQNAARNSMEWFEHGKRYMGLPVEQLAYSLLTRSQRVSHEELRLRDAAYVGGVERWFAGAASGTLGDAPPPPMFTPFRLRELTLANRVVVAPMDMYSARNGTPNDFHLVHLGVRALGGAALVMTEMACVSAEGRITPGCTGMYAPEHLVHWRRVVDFVHAWSPAKICLQLGHSGRKGAVCPPWEGRDLPLGEEGWPTMGPSPLSYASQLPEPREMTRVDMDRVRNEFVHATRMAFEAGFDMLELHAAHGYLISSFLTPVSNQRRDEYGGSLENRMRFPLEVLAAMRELWPAERPMSVRVSATDWTEDGLSEDDAVAIARAFAYEGADVIHVSTGQTTPGAAPVEGRLFQTPYSDRIRNEARVPTIAVGNVTEADQVNGIIAAGRADLVALGRPHLSDPHWTLHAAAALGFPGVSWPRQYQLGQLQHEREVARARDARERGGAGGA